METNKNKKLIFIVDDSEIITEMIKKYLESQGTYDIKTFKTGEDMVQYLDMYPDVILLDYHLSDESSKNNMDGEDVLKVMKKQGIDCKVVLISGYTDEKKAEELSVLGVVDFVDKHDEEVLENLDKTLSTHAV